MEIACALGTIAMVFQGSHPASSLLAKLHMAGLDRVEKTNHFLLNIFQTIVVVQLLLLVAPQQTFGNLNETH